jgi:hypothetical protein
MLIDLKEPLKEGAMLELALVFEKAGTVKVTAPILKIGAMSGSEAGSGSGSGPGSGPGQGSGSGSAPGRKR